MVVDTLKSELEKKVNTYLGNVKDMYASAKEAKSVLKKTNLSRALYVVALNPLWAHEGRKPISLEKRGTIEGAIRYAEKKFKLLNKKYMIGADYMVHIRLGDRYIEIPDTYWKQFCRLPTR